MIEKMAVTKVIRTVFKPQRPVQVMVSFHDKDGAQIGSQLFAASLFPEDIQEGDRVEFRLPPRPLDHELSGSH